MNRPVLHEINSNQLSLKFPSNTRTPIKIHLEKYSIIIKLLWIEAMMKGSLIANRKIYFHLDSFGLWANRLTDFDAISIHFDFYSQMIERWIHRGEHLLPQIPM